MTNKPLGNVYVAFAKKRFLSSMAYRFNHWMTILSSVFSIFIFFNLYRALYYGNTELDGITLSMVATNLINSFIIGDAFAMDDDFLRNKINNGTIANEFLRPVNFKLRILAEDLGQTIFNLIFRSGPAFLITVLWIGMEPPKSSGHLLLSMIALIFGFLVCWNLSFIVQSLAFWIINVWSISTIKGVLFSLLSGCILPLWFLPDAVRTIASFTPFESIYFGTVEIYLGLVNEREIVAIYCKQWIWIVLLYLVGDFLWKHGQKKLIVQGG